MADENVGRVTGMGGVELVAEKEPRKAFAPSQGVGAFCAAACQEEGAILRNMGDAIAFCPPLIINADQIDELCTKFERALDKTLNWLR